MNKKTENMLVFMWLVALIATLGSLYFSQIKQYEPCSLCWYQRILMYPLIIILLVGVLIRDRKAAAYSAALSFIGACLSIYHYSIQKLSFMSEAAPACGQVPCTGQYINWLGFVTIPFLAGIAFIIIFICSIFVLKRKEI